MSEENTQRQYHVLSEKIVELYAFMQRIKSELAAVKHPNSPIDHFTSVADQLSAIVDATENATNTIMEETESMAGIAGELKEKIQIGEVTDRLDSLVDHSNKVFEACTFQDITGQRISKIVKTMNLLEGTLNSLVVIIGEEGIAALPVAPVDNQDQDGDISMDGPALEGEGVSQAEIDALFD
jgi:chemotaxis regulatin CheY-phosphate phosphatase CheZ